MREGLVETAAQVEAPDDRRIYGIALAQVINNLDRTNQGRVQLHLPWLPGYEPWARVAVLMAGSNCGTCFIPQVGDEVPVAFNHGDVREPYVIGSLWNGQDQPPAKPASDPVNQRMIRTPRGHEVLFNDADQSITITGAAGARLSLTPQKIELVIGPASIVLEKSGNITLKTSTTLTLDAQTINISANANVAIGGRSSARIDGGSYCSINASQIFIG